MSVGKERRIGEKYEILKESGKGGAGKVYQVMDLKLGKTWAAKRVLKTVPRQEQQALSRLENSAFPRIVDTVEEGCYRYLIMDWIEGESLEKRLKREGALEAGEAVRIALAICRALEALHAMQPPLLYLDCKPSNIMTDGEGKLWLVDFGSAVENREQQADPIAASPGYAAPELLFAKGGGRCADVRSDVFGLGRTLYALLSGRNLLRPSDAACSLNDCSTKADEELSGIVERCMQTDPKKRYQTVEAVREALLSWEEKRENKTRLFCWRAAAKAGIAAGLCATTGSGLCFYRLVQEEGILWQAKAAALVFFAAAACMTVVWQKLGTALLSGSRPLCEPLQNVLRTEKKTGRWLLAWPIAVALCAALCTGQASGAAKGYESKACAPIQDGEMQEEAVRELPVVLRDHRMRKLLVRSGTPLRTEKSVYLELDPALFEPGQTFVVRVTAQKADGQGEEGEIQRAWTFLFCPKGPETGP